MAGMVDTLEPKLPGRLERSCGPAADRANAIRIGRGGPGIERLAARFHGRAFAPHRHDTYAIGVTISGVQTFRYRGEQRHCLQGECHVLHPDELHDGAAGTEDGFGYRILYLDPASVQQALGGRPLPFVAQPVIQAARLRREFVAKIIDIEQDMDTLKAAEIVSTAADVLTSLESRALPKRRRLDFAALERVRDAMTAAPERPHPLDELEQISGLDRWELARGFRAAFGVGPSRFRTVRQLDRVRCAVRSGAGLADAALAGGFADQAHMTRHFKRAYGLTPARWAAIIR
jgi:AraC-like DNA-binding protein